MLRDVHHSPEPIGPMLIHVTAEETISVGSPAIVQGPAPEGRYVAIFEDDGETGYFYAFDLSFKESPVQDAAHIYNVANVADRDQPAAIKIGWSADSKKVVLLINDYPQAIFDFDAKRGFCRTGPRPPEIKAPWPDGSQTWNDTALELFVERALTPASQAEPLMSNHGRHPMVNERLHIELPEPHYTVFVGERDGLPEILEVNEALLAFRHIELFPWHLCIWIKLPELVEKREPTLEEGELLAMIMDEIESTVLNGRTQNGLNAMPLARSTWKDARELMFQVHDPDVAKSELERLLSSRTWQRVWSYRMDGDPEWKQASSIFQVFPRANGGDA